jgi:hypothetical protein
MIMTKQKAFLLFRRDTVVLALEEVDAPLLQRAFSVLTMGSCIVASLLGSAPVGDDWSLRKYVTCIRDMFLIWLRLTTQEQHYTPPLPPLDICGISLFPPIVVL